MNRTPLKRHVWTWAQNLRRLLVPRPAWRAEAEFDYYRVDPLQLADQLARQAAWRRQGQFVGLGLVSALGLLDRQDLAGKRILELGAGECMLSQALLASAAGEVWAVDAVPKQIWAAAAANQASAGLHCAIADALDLPFTDGSFDLVVANLALHHIRPLGALLKEVFRVLTPGGRFCALEPAPLVGLLVHDQTSDNEAPLWPKSVTSALTDVGFVDAGYEYKWIRLNTSRLGVLSPSYAVWARRPGHQAASLGLRRELLPSALPGLQIDSGCGFLSLVDEQVGQLAACVSRQGLIDKR